MDSDDMQNCISLKTQSIVLSSEVICTWFIYEKEWLKIVRHITKITKKRASRMTKIIFG